MNKIYITGCGLASPWIGSLFDLRSKNIDKYPTLNVKQTEALLNQRYKTKNKKLISREDRSVIGPDTEIVIDAALEAFNYSEAKIKFSNEEKEEFPIFMVNESNWHTFEECIAFASLYKDKNGSLKNKELWKDVGKIRELLNPLGALRNLSTNQLYHISKLLNLRGGGYPLRRASLSSLSAVEEAFCRLKQKHKKALVAAAGNMTDLENLGGFEKMGLIKKKDGDDGILPSFGAACIVLEKDLNQSSLQQKEKKVLAELVDVWSVFKDDNVITHDDWINVFARTKQHHLQDISIISYDNGSKNLAKEEYRAINNFFHGSQIINYKKYIGYTGKANNLIDLVISISDKRIKKGSHILINGIGMLSGFGCMLIKKINEF